jgi:hypothetical protein
MRLSVSACKLQGLLFKLNDCIRDEVRCKMIHFEITTFSVGFTTKVQNYIHQLIFFNLQS